MQVGAFANQRDASGARALYLAARSGHQHAAEALASAGAVVDEELLTELTDLLTLMESR